MTGLNERYLYEILNEAYPGEWVSDIEYLEGRKYRGDAVNKKHKIIIEINGGLRPFYITRKDGRRVLAPIGGHNSTEGIKRDYEKSNATILAGWKILKYTPDQLKRTHWKVLSDVQMLCGYAPKHLSENHTESIVKKVDKAKKIAVRLNRDEAQKELSLDGCEQTRIAPLQVRLA